MSKTVSAAVALIGDELLSGRTQDVNLKTIAEFLAPVGIQIAEARVLSDDHERIASAVRDLARTYDYVFTTGGIGPTHDDITADAVAAAFGRPIDIRDDARAILEARYAETDVELTPARLRMARIPDGASLIDNPVSGAPGFQLENVFVMAGVPVIVKGMLQDVGHRLEGGAIVLSRTVRGKGLREGDIGEALGTLQDAMPELSFGSYPWFRAGDNGANLVVRGVDANALDDAVAALVELVKAHGRNPEVDPTN
ncbi:MAG: molybdopterin-binding protein [Pseudomonadota bacterium]